MNELHLLYDALRYSFAIEAFLCQCIVTIVLNIHPIWQTYTNICIRLRIRDIRFPFLFFIFRNELHAYNSPLRNWEGGRMNDETNRARDLHAQPYILAFNLTPSSSGRNARMDFNHTWSHFTYELSMTQMGNMARTMIMTYHYCSS